MDYSEFISSDERENERFDFYNDGDEDHLNFSVEDDMTILSLDDLAELDDIPF